MINYRKILEHHFNGMTQRTIRVAVGSSRNTIRDVVNKAREKGLEELEVDMTNEWLEEFLFPEKRPQAKENNSIPYAYRTYCEHYRRYAGKYKVTMPLKHKPGESMEVDWAGGTLNLSDKINGEDIKVYIFVATLPFSQYNYAEVFLDMTSTSWLTGHIHAFEYFNGIPEILIPDNLRTGVTKPDYAEPIINESYRELADYYQTVIVVNVK